MTARIEDQVHQAMIEAEEARCREIDRKRIAGTGGQVKPTKRRVIPKPKLRAGPNALIQDQGLLLLVSEYDFDLSDSLFAEYAKRRGVIHVAGIPGSHRWKFVTDFDRSRYDFVQDTHFQTSEAGIPYSDRELELKGPLVQADTLPTGPRTVWISLPLM